jgi:O-acetylserine/cysteine efflux transporter
MIVNRSRGVAALSVAGVAWGTSVPLSKVALAWLDPGWLTAVRFVLAASVLLALVPRQKLRAAFSWRVLAWGAAGYGGAVLVQNYGVERTSVTHASLLIGVGPVLIAVITALWRHVVARPLAWIGFGVSLAGVAAIAGGRGGGATGAGDALVLASTALIAAMTVAQSRLLNDRDPVAVTAVQFAGAALVTLPFAACADGLPAAPSGAGPVLAVLALAAAATLLPFTLFAYGQRRVPAEVAGAFLNLEPLVGAAIGIVAFGDAVGPRQLLGGAAIVAGIALSASSPRIKFRVRGETKGGMAWGGGR